LREIQFTQRRKEVKTRGAKKNLKGGGRSFEMGLNIHFGRAALKASGF
jgi:hypothetical protein